MAQLKKYAINLVVTRILFEGILKFWQFKVVGKSGLIDFNRAYGIYTVQLYFF